MNLSIVQFGDILLKTGDLDPVYLAIDSVSLTSTQMSQLLLTYWCVYHLGVAAKLAEVPSGKYWDALYEVAENTSLPNGDKPWPRGSERRHFRGEQAIRAVEELQSKYKHPRDALEGFLGETPRSFASVSAAVQSHRGFGDWIAFKVADMTERVLREPVDFGNCELGIYKDPRQGAAIAFLAIEGNGERLAPWENPWDYPINDEELKLTVDHYVKLWRKRGIKAPPRRDRLVTVQEVETIFCKFKSHLKGHYPPGKDTIEVRHALTGWGKLAERMKEGVPEWRGANL